MAARREFGLDGPIAIFDTEKSAHWHNDRVKAAIGSEPLAPHERADGTSMRGLDELKDFLGSVKEHNVSVVIIDQLTHILHDLREVYFAKHDIRFPKPDQYGMADAPLTKTMKRLVDSSINIICCAREQQVYGRYQKKNGDWTEGPVSVKFGAKESAYDFDILAHMQMVPVKGGAAQRVLTIDKDRSDTVNGKAFTFPYQVSEVFGGYLKSMGKVGGK